ncbi:MAG: VOC family protein, partial [Rhodoferax sp.]|nr:VOC family protein [Rhodoferax sp.]
RAGAMQQAPESPMPSFWLPYIHVADCDAAGAKARELGAVRTILPPTDIPGIGRFTVIIDPLGAPIGLIKGAG